VITDLSPYRATFDPIDQDQLSPLAAYDLSKQLREPIRVFGELFVASSEPSLDQVSHRTMPFNNHKN